MEDMLICAAVVTTVLLIYHVWSVREKEYITEYNRVSKAMFYDNVLYLSLTHTVVPHETQYGTSGTGLYVNSIDCPYSSYDLSGCGLSTAGTCSGTPLVVNCQRSESTH